MKIAVTDANIFIDLITIETIHFFFELNFEFHTTFPVFDQLNSKQQEILTTFINKNKLIKYNFSFEELSEISELEFPKALEAADCSVFYYSKKINASVLSGDKRLKSYCESRSIEVKGILWIFDNLIESKIISPKEAAQKLSLLLKINDRLPQSECIGRINKWYS